MSTTAENVKVHDNMPAEVYHAQTDRVSNSMRKVFRDSPELFDGYFVSKSMAYEPPTKAKLFGASVHKLVLEGISNTVIQIPDSVLAKNGAKLGKAWDDFAAVCAERNLTPLKRAEYDAMLEVQQKIMEHPIAPAALLGREAHYERSIFWVDADTGLNLRCRIDSQSEGPMIIGDLKVLHDVSADGFARAARKFGYDSQQYLYRQAVLALTGCDYCFVFVCVESKSPYRVRCYELNGDFQDMAEADTRTDLERIATCYQTGIWRSPGWGRIQTVAPPSFARYEKEWEYQEDGDGSET